jgi:pyruvate, water dikinase
MTLRDARLVVPLAEATVATCGGKAGPLGALLRANLPVPDGFVVPLAVHRAAARAHVEASPLPTVVMEALERALADLGDPAVAVRSSAEGEDGSRASAAGQYESTLGVHGVADVATAVSACWTSLHSTRATAYRTRFDARGSGPADIAMAVLVQAHLDAEVSGVLFTPAGPNEPTVIEASWGLGTSVVAGRVTPDAYRMHADGTVTCVIADKPTRLDRVGSRLLASDVAPEDRRRPTLDETTATGLATLGNTVAITLGAPQDIEWAVAGGRLWILQSRPVTAAPPTAAPSGTSACSVTLTGTPGSGGTATGTARTVRGPRDYPRARPGDILICPYTDPAWTPLLRIAAGVVTETGGALSHAAIVARECQIPAVLGVPRATAVVIDGSVVTIDGGAGTVVIPEPGPTPTHE